jgi:hypothetical protein
MQSARRAESFFHLYWLVAMLLTLVLYLPAGAQSSGAGESVSVWSPNQVEPEIQAELARLRNLIQKHKLSFLVDYSPALEYP